jgi:DNA-binding MarR family transcriptional regulator
MLADREGAMAHKKQEPTIRVGPDFEEEWPGASALATEIALNFSSLYERCSSYLEALVRRHGITSLPAFNALAILRGAGEALPPSVIAERMVRSAGTMTELLDALERRGMVQRVPSAEDRRMRLVEITPDARARLERVLPEFHRAERHLVRGLTKAQQQHFLGLLAALQATPPDD